MLDVSTPGFDSLEAVRAGGRMGEVGGGEAGSESGESGDGGGDSRGDWAGDSSAIVGVRGGGLLYGSRDSSGLVRLR